MVKQDFTSPRLAANYAPGDEIHYKTGSPAEHGIADNSTATVLSVDGRTNTLSRELAVQQAIPGVETALQQSAISPTIESIPTPSVPQIELAGFGIGL